MNASKHREIVVEIEKVQLIRRRTKTKLLFCSTCRQQTYFISADEAAALFITDTDRIFHFISVNECHIQTQADGSACICLTAFLDTVRTKIGGSRIKLIGDLSK